MQYPLVPLLVIGREVAGVLACARCSGRLGSRASSLHRPLRGTACGEEEREGEGPVRDMVEARLRCRLKSGGTKRIRVACRAAEAHREERPGNGASVSRVSR